MSQRAREDCAWQDMKSVENEMNATYRDLLAKYKKKPAIRRALLVAQKRWTAYRDALLDSYFPDVPDIRGIWGSQMAECSARYKTAVTIERTHWLKQMLGEPPSSDMNDNPSDLCPFPF